jgi:hypothetical protein
MIAKLRSDRSGIPKIFAPPALFVEGQMQSSEGQNDLTDRVTAGQQMKRLTRLEGLNTMPTPFPVQGWSKA